jgi:hypothetical protein
VVNAAPEAVILHHRTVHPVVIRERPIPMEQYEGAIYQSQRTIVRFWTPSSETAKQSEQNRVTKYLFGR